MKQCARCGNSYAPDPARPSCPGCGSPEVQPEPAYDPERAERHRKLVAIVVDQLGIEERKIVPEANLVDDLGCDDLDIVELAIAIEEEFEVGEVSDEDIGTHLKDGNCPFSALVSFVESRIAEKNKEAAK